MENLTKSYKINKNQINGFLDVLNNLYLNYEFLRNDNNDLINDEYYILFVENDDNIENECKKDNVEFEILK